MSESALLVRRSGCKTTYSDEHRKAPRVRLTRKQVQARARKLPVLRFEDQRLTSYSGMVLFQALFRRLVLKGRLLRSLGRAKGTAYGTEGSAIGYNRKRRGARSYYPLLCTVAQTGQFLDVHHRPGNMHDSNGAYDFMADCLGAIRNVVPAAKLETRIDSAFFDITILEQFDEQRVEFSVSVPFERLPELKGLIEKIVWYRWIAIDDRWSYAEITWRPKCWDRPHRILVLRQRVALPIKGPLQLDLFVPRDYQHDYCVIATNKTSNADAIRLFHHGRGTQEGLIGEAKTHAQLDYVPTRKLVANQLFLTASLMAHNLGRELQMTAKPRSRTTSPTRAALWEFENLGTLRHRLLQRAGRLTTPKGVLTLTLSANHAVQRDYEEYLRTIQVAA